MDTSPPPATAAGDGHDGTAGARSTALTLSYRLLHVRAVVHAGEHYSTSLTDARTALKATVATIRAVNPNSGVLAVMEVKRGTYHSHVVVVGDGVLCAPVLDSDHWFRAITTHDHAANLGRYILKGALSEATYVEHLAMNGGRITTTVTSAFWSGPWGDTQADCQRARRANMTYPKPKKITRTAMFTPAARDGHRSAADARAKQVLRAVQDQLGGLPARWTPRQIEQVAQVLGCSPHSVRTTVRRAHDRAVALRAKRS